MVILVVGTNFLVFRPLVAWAERFRMETSESAEKPKSIVLDFLRRSADPPCARPAVQAHRALPGPGDAVHSAWPSTHSDRTCAVAAWATSSSGPCIIGASGFVAVSGMSFTSNADLGFCALPLRSSHSGSSRSPGLWSSLVAVDDHLGAGGGQDRHEAAALPLCPARGAGAGQLPGHPAVPLHYRSSSMGLGRPLGLSAPSS